MNSESVSQSNHNNSFKITTTEDNTIKEGGNTPRHEDSSLNTKRKKKRLIKTKDELKNKSSSVQINKKILIKQNDEEVEPKVNNIIIHINNQINTHNSNQKISVNTVKTLENSKKDGGRINSPTGFVELQIDNNNPETLKYNDRVLEVNQNRFFVKLNRLFFSQKCEIYYTILVVICAIISLASLIDIFINLAIMNQIWLFVTEMIIFAIISFDTCCRIYILKSEYMSNLLLLLVDIITAILIPLQIIRFASQTNSIVTLILHFLFCSIFAVRFFLVLNDLKKSFKRQEDVRHNVEEIINFSEMMEENNPKPSSSTSKQKRLKKITPAISFVDDLEGIRKKGLDLVKENSNEIPQND